MNWGTIILGVAGATAFFWIIIAAKRSCDRNKGFSK